MRPTLIYFHNLEHPDGLSVSLKFAKSPLTKALPAAPVRDACASSVCVCAAVETLDVPYQEVTDVVTVGRAMGLWGDMVITLKDTTKLELRSLAK